jgi:hypothetical protein
VLLTVPVSASRRIGTAPPCFVHGRARGRRRRVEQVAEIGSDLHGFNGQRSFEMRQQSPHIDDSGWSQP